MKFFLIFFILTLSVHSQTPAPPTFTRNITFSGETITVNFTKFSSRASGMTVIEHTADITEPIDPAGLFTPFTFDSEVRTYIGSVTEYPGAMAAGIIRADGEILARVTFADGSEWQDINGTITSRTDSSPNISAPTTLLTTAAGSNIHAADIVIDLPFPQVTASGGNTAESLEMAEYSMTCINAYFLRDAAVMHRVIKVVVRLDANLDPYQGQTTTNQMLGEIRTQQGATIDGSNPAEDFDIALTASPQVGGGLAFVGAIGNATSSNGANANGDFTVVARHELGHNWGSNHFEGGSPEGRTIMSGNSLGKFSSSELLKIINHRNARATAHLDLLGSTAPALPPRAIDDVVVAEIGSPSVTLSPLNNDNDINGGALTISSVSLTSDLGLTPTLSGTDIDVPIPSDYSSRTDSFSYSIRDSDNQQASARVHTRTFMAGDILGHYTFDQEAEQALDSSPQIAHGTLRGNASLTGGVLNLDGDGDRSDARIISPDSNTITYSAMLFRDGEQNDFAGIIFQNSGGTSSGLNFGTNNELRYHWNNSSNWAWNSGLTVPDGIWTYVALVISPTEATIYMQPEGQPMQNAVRTLPHPLKPHVFYALGQNTGSSSRYVKGMLDDVRIIRRSLSLTEITDLAAGGTSACDPVPTSGSELSANATRLSWTPGPLSIQSRLYLSNSYTELRDATEGSPSDQGLVASNYYDLNTLTPGFYYWRIDSTTASGQTVKGSLWVFQVIPEGLVAHWPLDELSGTTANDVAGSNNGNIIGNPTLGTNGATLTSATCHCCDGDDDYVEIPQTPIVNPEIFTLSLWARVDGGQGSFRSAITSRQYTPNNGGFIIYAENDDDWSLWISDGNSHRQLDADDVTLGKWTHLVASYDGSTARFYIDGQEVGSRNQNYAPNLTHPMRIGGGTTENASSGFDFVGCLDDIRLWGRALSLSEIQSLYPYEQWATSNGYAGAERDIAATPSSNGLPNILNYAFATPDNTTNAATGIIQMQMDRSARLSIPSNLRDELSYTIQTSSTLMNDAWTTIATRSPNSLNWTINQPSMILLSTESTATSTILDSITDSATERFWRIRVQAP